MPIKDVKLKLNKLFLQVSESLRREWQPVEDKDLPAAVLRDEEDAEAAYMNILLADQKFDSKMLCKF